MDFLYLVYYLSLFITCLMGSLVVLRKRKSSIYSRPTWYYSIKKLMSKPSVKSYQKECKSSTKFKSEMDLEMPQSNLTEYESDSNIIFAADTNGNYFSIILNFKSTLHMDISIEFRSKCGKIYRLPNEPSLQIYSTTSRHWKAGGLNIEILNPLRRLRITYNGIMRCTSSNNNKGQLEFVHFNFFWNTATEPVFHPQDTHVDLLTDSVAREPWRDGEWIRMLGKDCSFEQYGVLQGHFSATSFPDEIFLYMPSWRRRRWGPSDALAIRRDVSIFSVGKDGTVFSIGARSYKIGATQLRYGTILMSNGMVKSISNNDITLEYLADNKEIPNIFTVHFEVEGKTYKCVSHVNTNKISLTTSEEERGWLAKTTNVECDVNVDQGKGLVRFWYQKKGEGVKLPPPLLIPQQILNPEDIFVVSLESSQCLDLSLTGGKGNSLGLLSSMKSSEFRVPSGFIVTVNSFRQHLNDNPNLVESIEKLHKVCCGIIDGKPEEICKETVELIKNSSINESVIELIKKELSFDGDENYGWAVRSSGIGEDSDELSAAGQNSTFLGCKTLEEVLKAIAACWGSLFTYQSVEYRRQHGLAIKCDMAVVVQKMVPAECAGVLFTSHPTTGDISQMVITSNYGLGESVVSASADPDTITLAKSIKGNLKILSSVMGTKKLKIILGNDIGKNEVGNTEEIMVDENLSEKMSISEEQIIKLGKIGVLLENAFGNPRDIEWAFFQDELYLLQSRPITTLNTWSDWELEHEFDSPIMSNYSLYSRANVGEVVKGAVSPLTQSTSMQMLENVMQAAASNGKYTDYYRRCMLINSHFVFLDVTNFMFNNVTKKITMENRITDIAIFGHEVLDEKVLRIALDRHGAMNAKQKLQLFGTNMEMVINNKYAVKKAVEFNEMWNMKIGDSETAKNLMSKIDFNLQSIQVAGNYHIGTTRTSIIYQMIAMTVLAENHDQFNSDHYHDISLLLAANDNVESAQIPVILERIANEIRKENLAEEFVKIKPEEGLNWFEEKLPECKEKLDRFLRIHGHRTFRESELFAKTWDMKPEMVISMLQSNCLTETTTRKAASLTVDETVRMLISPKRTITKKILKFIVKKCRAAVASRETTKSVVIKTIHKFRIAFNELGKKMVQESYIPRSELVFFFTIEELRSHLKERNPVLVSKAIRRRKLYEKWNLYHFPELIYGIPVPEQERSEEIKFSSRNGFKLQGTPVCKGQVVGRACVITDFSQVGEIESGDILITFSTDVAWSPYFPVLSGVVTEIGGLISHGAVVAREYGLPCVVGAQNATKYFKTGDRVLLDGKSGTIELVE